MMARRMAWIAGALLAGCSQAEYSHDYDRSQDFSAFRSWTWAPAPQERVVEVARVSPLNRERIVSAIENEMSAKQFVKVDPKSAELLVRYHAAMGQRFDSDSPSSADWGVGDPRLVDEGTLVIDVLRAKDGRLIWRGMARTVVDFDATPEERERQIREVVHGILEGFPPKK